jgi:hypothetical protein
VPPPPRASLQDTPLLDIIAETVVIAAWLAVPLFALLAAGRLAPPLHAAGIATILTLAYRWHRSARRGQALNQIQQRLPAHRRQAAFRPVPSHEPHDQAPRRHKPTIRIERVVERWEIDLLDASGRFPGA